VAQKVVQGTWELPKTGGAAMIDHDKVIEVVKAHKDGKTIQAHIHGVWHDLDAAFFTFNFSCGIQYRVKPGPRVVYVNEYIGPQFTAYGSKDEALKSVRAPYALRKAVKYQEVID
jgi:hypothetical protein